MKAMKDASPTVKAGRRKCQATTQANWSLDRISGSRCTRADPLDDLATLTVTAPP